MRQPYWMKVRARQTRRAFWQRVAQWLRGAFN
jgi:hypothetical protein